MTTGTKRSRSLLVLEDLLKSRGHLLSLDQESLKPIFDCGKKIESLDVNGEHSRPVQDQILDIVQEAATLQKDLQDGKINKIRLYPLLNDNEGVSLVTPVRQGDFSVEFSPSRRRVLTHLLSVFRQEYDPESAVTQEGGFYSIKTNLGATRELRQLFKEIDQDSALCQWGIGFSCSPLRVSGQNKLSVEDVVKLTRSYETNNTAFDYSTLNIPKEDVGGFFPKEKKEFNLYDHSDTRWKSLITSAKLSKGFSGLTQREQERYSEGYTLQPGSVVSFIRVPSSGKRLYFVDFHPDGIEQEIQGVPAPSGSANCLELPVLTAAVNKGAINVRAEYVNGFFPKEGKPITLYDRHGESWITAVKSSKISKGTNAFIRRESEYFSNQGADPVEVGDTLRFTPRDTDDSTPAYTVEVVKSE